MENHFASSGSVQEYSCSKMCWVDRLWRSCYCNMSRVRQESPPDYYTHDDINVQPLPSISWFLAGQPPSNQRFTNESYTQAQVNVLGSYLFILVIQFWLLTKYINIRGSITGVDLTFNAACLIYFFMQTISSLSACMSALSNMSATLFPLFNKVRSY